eukprot:c18563_g1_i1 orf=126-635(+)
MPSFNKFRSLIQIQYIKCLAKPIQENSLTNSQPPTRFQITRHGQGWMPKFYNNPTLGQPGMKTTQTAGAQRAIHNNTTKSRYQSQGQNSFIPNHGSSARSSCIRKRDEGVRRSGGRQGRNWRQKAGGEVEEMGREVQGHGHRGGRKEGSEQNWLGLRRWAMWKGGEGRR